MAGLTGSSGNISGNLLDTDDSSLENNLSGPVQSTLNSLSNETTSLLQSAIDKNTLAEAQDIISNLQFVGQNNNDFSDIIKSDPDADANISEDIDYFEDELISLTDGNPLLTEHETAFNLQAPTIIPNYINFHYICECGSRILFLSIFWFKKFHPFRLLR